MTAVTKEAFVLVLFALLFRGAAQEVTMLITPFVFRSYDIRGVQLS